MMVDDDDNDEVGGSELVKLLKVQRELSGIKGRDETNKVLLTAITTLSDAVEDMVKASASKTQFDEKISGQLISSIEGLSTALKEIKSTDLTPVKEAQDASTKATDKQYNLVASLILDLKEQNKQIADKITNIPQPAERPDNSGAYMNKIDAVLKAMVRNNEVVLEAISKLQQPVQQPAEKEWTHKIKRNNGRIDSIVSTANNK